MDTTAQDGSRLWIPRGQPVMVDEQGYTVFVSGKWRPYYNADAKLTSELLDVSDVIVLLGEPGSGKSFELSLLNARAHEVASRHVSYLDLGRYPEAGRLDAALRRELRACMNDSVPTILFLDSLDESRVNIKCAEAVLEDALLDVSPNLLQLVITCRTPAWPDSLTEFLQKHWKKNNSQNSAVSIFEIVPYSKEQVSIRLSENSLDKNSFFEAINSSNAHGLARQPLGLKFLMSQFMDGSTFSTSRWELYDRGCAALLKENNSRRMEGGSSCIPNVQSRLQLAGLVATCVLLTNNTDIVLDKTGDFAPSEALCLDVGRLLTVPLDACGDDWHATIAQYLETLQSGLFIAKEDGVFVFAHRTYAEFLAARFISALNLPTSQVMEVLTLPDNSGRLVPQLRELAAWLGHSNPELLSLVLSAEPEMVFDSSVSLTDEAHIEAIFDELASLVERNKLPIYDRRQIRAYHKLRHPGLLEKLREILSNHTRPVALRQFAADVTRQCGLADQLPELIYIALDASENYQVRQSAVEAISTGSQEAKKSLWPLFTHDNPEDIDGTLRGLALHCALDSGASIGELIGFITRERRSNLSGMYALALRQLENKDVQAADILPLLSWLVPQLSKEADRMDFGWEDFVAHMFSKAAFAVISSNEGWETLGKVAWLAIANHHKLSASRETQGFDKGLGLEEHPNRRLRLLDSILNAAEGDPQNIAWQLRHGAGLLNNSDGPCLIDMYQHEQSSKANKKIIAYLAFGYVYSCSMVREWLLNSAGPNAKHRDLQLAELASEYVDTVQLDSAKADALRSMWTSIFQGPSPTKPPPEKQQSIDLLLAALTRAQNGDSWEWVNILSYLRYEDSFGNYHHSAREVITSPLWPKLNPVTHRQLIDVAFAYLHANGPVSNLPVNHSNSYEDAGIAALVLLHSVCHGCREEFRELVLKWALALARYGLEEQPRAAINELLQHACSRDETTLVLLLTKICEQHLAIEYGARLPDFATDFMPGPLLHALEKLLPQIKNEPGFLVLSEFLIEHGSYVAIEQLLARIQSISDLSVAPAPKLLVQLSKYAPNQLITHVWGRLKQNPAAVAQLAAKLQVLMPSQEIPLLRVDAVVTEEIFEILEKQYPSADDERLHGFVTERHYIQDVRTSCLLHLRNRSDANGVEALERIAIRHPDITWTASLIKEAEQKLARDSWLPYEVCEVPAVLGISTGRVIRTEAELHAAVHRELLLIADKISATARLPAVHFLWDETSQRPKHEPRLCDWLASELESRLSDRDAIVNREVQVRSHNPKGVGERTDILVQLVSPAKSGKSSKTLSLVIEVKGCWNNELTTAPSSQLRDNYMSAYGASLGIYLVMWFMCERWTSDDSRKRKTQSLIPDGTYKACIDIVADACHVAFVEGITVTPVTIDCTY